MAKNMTRGGIAIAAGAALVATGLVASPAYAVTYIETEVATGKVLNTLTGINNGLTLNTSISSLMTADDETLTYRIENPSGVDVIAGVSDETSASANVTLAATKDSTNTFEWYEYGEATDLADGTVIGSFYDQDETDLVIVPGSNNEGDYTKNNLLKLAVADGTAKDYSLTVTAWLDVDGDQTIDGTEQAAESVTINFYDEDSITASSSVSRSVNGEDEIQISTTLTPELNGTQLGASIVDAEVTSQGNANSVVASKTMKDDGTMGSTTYNSTTKVYTTTAYLDYSLANDAWTGSNASFAADEIDLSGEPAADDRFFVHNLGDSTGDVIAIGVAASASTGDLISAKTTSTIIQTEGYSHVYLSDITADGTVSGDVIIDRATYTASIASNVASFAISDGDSLQADVATDSAKVITEGTFRYLVAADQQTVTTGNYAAAVFLSYTNDSGSAATEALADSAPAGVVKSGTYDVEAVVAGADNYTYIKNADAGSAGTTNVREDYEGEIPVVVTVDDKDGNPVGAGVPVTAEVSGEQTDINVNGTAVANGSVISATTDSNGQVTMTVNSDDASASEGVTLTIRAANSVNTNSAQIIFDWEAPTYSLYDLKDPTDEDSRSLVAGGGMSFDMAVVDQFGAILADADYRLFVELSGRSVSTTTHSLAGGTVNVAVTDNGLGSGSVINVDAKVQKLVGSSYDDSNGLSGGSDLIWNTSSDRRVINVIASTVSTGVLLNEDEANANGGDTVEVHGQVGTTALAAADNRLTSADVSGNGTNVVVSGKIANATTLAALGGAEVSITGPSNILFMARDSGGSVSDVYSFGSSSMYVDSSGLFTFHAWSNIQQSGTELTVTANGVSEEIEVDFQGVTALAGTSMTVDGPDFVSPGSTLVVEATLTDKFGNGVDTTTDLNYDAAATTSAGAYGDGDSADADESTNFKVTYVGDGINVNALPTTTDSDGKAKVQALLGTNDSGTITITFSYDHDNDGNYTDDDDIVVTKTITIGDAPVTQKVNAGSFKGFVAVYARGYEDQRLSAKIGNDWVIVDPIVNNQEKGTLFRVTDFTGAGVDIAVRIYIDRVLVDTIPLTTK